MALYDEPGTATWPDCSKFGHFVFLRISGEKKDKYIVCAEVEKCPQAKSPTLWKAHFRQLSPAQLERGSYNPQMSFPLDEVPAIIAALAKTYESITLKSSPPEGQAYIKQYAESEGEKEAQAFTRTSSEF